MGGLVFSVVLTVHVLAGLGVIGLVLMQHGKGADMGAAFGSGASGSLFGSSGSANFLSRTTAALAAVFCYQPGVELSGWRQDPGHEQRHGDGSARADAGCRRDPGAGCPCRGWLEGKRYPSIKRCNAWRSRGLAL